MRHVIVWAHFSTCLKFLRHAFRFISKMDMNGHTHIYNAYMYSNKGLQKECFDEKFPKIFIKTILLKC